MPPWARMSGFLCSASGVKLRSFEAMTIHTSRPSADFPSETIFRFGDAFTSRFRYTTVSSYRGVVRKLVASEGVTHGSVAGTASARLAPFHRRAGGRMAGWETRVAERTSAVSIGAF